MAFYARVFGCVPVHVPEEARDLAQMLSSIAFHLVFESGSYSDPGVCQFTTLIRAITPGS